LELGSSCGVNCGPIVSGRKKAYGEESEGGAKEGKWEYYRKKQQEEGEGKIKIKRSKGGWNYGFGNDYITRTN